MKIVLSLIYICIIIIANLTATMFISLPFGLGIISYATLIFGIVFTLRDRLHVYGKRWVYIVILMSGCLSMVANIISETPIRIVIASFIALCLSEFADTEVFAYLKQKSWLIRVLTSNAISVPLDTLIFNFLAFYGVSTIALDQVILGEMVWKYSIAGVLGVVLILESTSSKYVQNT